MRIAQNILERSPLYQPNLKSNKTDKKYPDNLFKPQKAKKTHIVYTIQMKIDSLNECLVYY